MANSILQDLKEDYFTGETQNLQCHHIFFGAKRKISEQWGFKVWLTYENHQGTEGVHGKYGHDKDMALKQAAQAEYERLGHTRQQFIDLIGRNYL